MAKEAEILLEDALGLRQTGGLPVMRRDPRFASPVEQLYKTQRAKSSFASYSPPILFSLAKLRTVFIGLPNSPAEVTIICATRVVSFSK